MYKRQRLGKEVIEKRYGNLFDMYKEITDVNPYEQPMQIFPAVHYTMGGIWVDYNLMTTIPGLYAIGEANFSDHGGNRLGASALMQGLADGYFILPYTIGDYLAGKFKEPKTDINAPEFAEAEKAVVEKIEKLFAVKGKRSVDSYHKELGLIMWNNVGMARTKESLEKAIVEIAALRKEFWKNVKVVGTADSFNVELEKVSCVSSLHLEVVGKTEVKSVCPRRVNAVSLCILALVLAEILVNMNEVKETLSIVWRYESEVTVSNLLICRDVDEVVVVTVTVHIVNEHVRVVVTASPSLIDEAVVVAASVMVSE